MKIKFDSSLAFQRDAIHSILDIFSGQEIITSNFTVYSPEFLQKQRNIDLRAIGYANMLTLSEGKIVENVQRIQLANGLKPSSNNEINPDNLDFTIEMETGTGKTYVYLRTIMEMYQKYGFAKHIIVVPSIPIKEGVFKSLQMTEEHFKELYDNLNYHYFIYDSSKLNEVRDFATNDGLEIMVINIDAFRKSFQNPEDDSKKANIIHRYDDKLGYKPLDLIRETKPVVFIDEPQSTMSTPLARKAVNSLNPMGIIRYSATHREKINLMYKLDAVDAYEKKLVKQIEVGSVQTEGVNNQAYIKLLKINLKKGKPTAKLEIDVLDNGKIKRKPVTVKETYDLEQITDRQEYKGYIIEDIYGAEGNEYISFSSQDDIIRLGQAIGHVDDKQVKTALIRQTIEEHLDKELALNPKGIKVLSLFFIDSVEKYRRYDEEGKDYNGDYADIFEKEYAKAIRKPKYVSLFGEIEDVEIDASAVHNGYFAVDKKGKKSNNKKKYEYFKDTTGNTKADEDTYNLIMKDKETLLSFYDGKDDKKKVKFIFSHSALKEGWDNPNVFQICTLKDAGKSEIRRRQEIGRGLRLAVNQQGQREHGHETNILTVMATESYVDFVDNLQKEIEKETGIRFGIVEDHTFSNVVVDMDGDEAKYFGQENSQELFNYMMLKGYVDNRGKVQDLLRIHLKEERVELPEEVDSSEHLKAQVINKLKDAAGKLEIKNKDDKKHVKVNRRVIDSEEFRELWERVKYKTTFSVNFDSESLVKECITALNERLRVSRGRLHYSKAQIGMSIGGVVYEEKEDYISTIDEEVEHLPDIVSYLQNETQLTRKSIVRILTGTDKLRYFKINPQKFIEGCIEIINEQMRLHIIDGIKYHKMGDAEFYSQELFENEELYGYLKSNLKESEKSPYEYVVYDSNVESRLAMEFEKSSNISVYAKLPSWFKIDTPLGTYNPDWAVLWKDEKEEKLFFVVESKAESGLLNIDTRPVESGKIKCGKKHFEELGCDLIKVKDIKGVRDYIGE